MDLETCIENALRPLNSVCFERRMDITGVCSSVKGPSHAGNACPRSLKGKEGRDVLAFERFKVIAVVGRGDVDAKLHRFTVFRGTHPLDPAAHRLGPAIVIDQAVELNFLAFL
jgi:hypothetical protein